MTDIRLRRRGRFAAALVLATVALTSTTAPAWADAGPAQEPPERVCWLNADTGVTQCFDDEDAAVEAVYEQTGTILREEGAPVARQSVGLRASYVLAKLHEDTAYGGLFTFATASSSTFCTSGTINQSSMPSGWNDRVSSVNSSYGCQTRVYANSGFGGTNITVTDTTNLGSMDNLTSSYQVF